MGLVCWKKGKKDQKRKGNWDCSRRYHWIDDNEKCANNWKPDHTIRWLIIAESPPCPTFHDEPPYIYRITKQDEERPILDSIVSAFMKASGETKVLASKEDKLDYMKNEEGAFLMDLCCYPLNKMKPTIRRDLREDSEYEFYLRLLGLIEEYHRRIENIVIVGVGWHENALQAIEIAHLNDLLRNRETEIPFPSHWRNNHERCVGLLSKIFVNPKWEKTFLTTTSSRDGSIRTD